MGTIDAVKRTLTRANGSHSSRTSALDPARAREHLRAHLIAHLTTALARGERATLEVIDEQGRTVECFTRLADGPYAHRQA